MEIKEIIKNAFFSSFSETITFQSVVTTGIISVLFSLGVYVIYLFSCDKTIYSKKFNTAMSLMSVITAFLIMSIQANIVISLGIVGALSIVRFRTAIKEPKDLLFLFWSISSGIIIGAGLYGIAFVLSVVTSVALLGFEIISLKKKKMLLVVKLTNIENENLVEDVFKNLKIKFNVKSKNILKNKIDIIYELATRKDKELLVELSKNEEINALNLIK